MEDRSEPVPSATLPPPTLEEIRDWLNEGLIIDKPSIEDGWFCVNDLLAAGMTEHTARTRVKQRVARGELETVTFSRTKYYKKV